MAINRMHPDPCLRLFGRPDLRKLKFYLQPEPLTPNSACFALNSLLIHPTIFLIFGNDNSILSVNQAKNLVVTIRSVSKFYWPCCQNKCTN